MMKKFVVSLVNVLILLAPTLVLAEDWVPVSRQVLIDADSVNVNRRDLNIRHSSEIFRWNRPGFLLVHRVSDCANRRTKILEEVTYNNVGRVVNRKSFKNRGRYMIPNRGRYVMPGSIESHILNFICK